jgi:hypothetical protein
MSIINREAWLTTSVNLMRDGLFAQHNFRVPEQTRISVGFPHGTRAPKGGKVIGQCWQPASSADAHGEIFIHPMLDDAVQVLGVVAHELVHSVNHAAGETGHGAAFKRIAVPIGLEGKMTATIAGAALTEVLKQYGHVLGAYPHKALSPNEAVKKQGTHLIKLLCLGCGYTVRTTQKWLDCGVPVCCCGHGDLQLEGEEE